MQTKDGIGASPTAATIFTGQGMTTMRSEIAFRMRRLESEAHAERLAGLRVGIRGHLGHALMALGRAIQGIEAERPARRALDLR